MESNVSLVKDNDLSNIKEIEKLNKSKESDLNKEIILKEEKSKKILDEVIKSRLKENSDIVRNKLFQNENFKIESDNFLDRQIEMGQVEQIINRQMKMNTNPIKRRVEIIRSNMKQPEVKVENKITSKTEDNLKENKQTNQKVKYNSPTKILVNNMLDHTITTVFFTILTIYALFADDVKMITCDLSYDQGFSIAVIIVIFLFSVEFVLSCIYVDKYFNSFFFYLDFVSLISMVLDIHWIYNFVINPDANNYAYLLSLHTQSNAITSSSRKGVVTSQNQQSAKVTNIAQLARATRGARVGSRAIRVLRVLRLIRLIRIAKLYKAHQNLEVKNKDVAKEEELKEKNEIQIPEESKVGKKLSDLTTKRIIVLVIMLIIASMLFNANFYSDSQTSMSLGITFFNFFPSVMDPDLIKAFSIYVDNHKNISSPIIYARVVNLTYGNDIYFRFRDTEKIEVNDDCPNLASPNDVNNGCYALFDNTSFSRLDSLLNIIKTLLICIVLTVGSLTFSKDTNDLILEPIEGMITKIKNISSNPLDAMQKAEEEEFLKAKLLEEETESCCVKSDKKEGPLETMILEKTISKIGALLALGFGEAGSEIISKNMQNNEGDVNPMIPGKKVIAIYGFCDIRNFTDATEVLQENVMIFVNEIAEIVHEIAAQYNGSANKNIGDAFLLVWKFSEEYVESLENGDIILKKGPEINQIMNMVIVALIRMLVKIYTSYKLDKYRKHQGLSERINNYSVKLGFGLHSGWSIEGAIGSSFKIDASYLSPHVNMASKLEEKTKDYGAQLILSGEVIKHLTDQAKKYTRPIDIIKFNQGEPPITIYTIDLDLSVLKIEDEKEEIQKEIKLNSKFEKVLRRNQRKLLFQECIEKKRDIWSEIEEDENFINMRKKYKPEFYKTYKHAFEQYKIGDWDNAKENFEKAQEILGEKDGPCKILLEFMGEHKFNSHDWPGYRNDVGH